MSRHRPKSPLWLKKKEERKERRKGMEPKPRDDLGFIIVTLPDGTTGRKFDTKRAMTEAQVDRAIEFNAEKRESKTKPKPKKKVNA